MNQIFAVSKALQIISTINTPWPSSESPEVLLKHIESDADFVSSRDPTMKSPTHLFFSKLIKRKALFFNWLKLVVEFFAQKRSAQLGDVNLLDVLRSVVTSDGIWNPRYLVGDRNLVFP